MLRAIGIAVLCSGCAQVLGIDETSSIGSLAVRLQRASVGAAVEFNPLDVGTTLPSFVIRDASATGGMRLLEAAGAEPGRWVAPTNAVDGVVYSYPESPIPHLLSFPKFSGADLRAYVRLYEHPNPQPAPSPPPDVTINVSLPSVTLATESFSVETVGSWVYYPVPPPTLATTILANTTSYSAFGPFQRVPGGTVGQVTSQDVLAVLRHDSVGGVRRLTGQLSYTAEDQTSAPMVVAGQVAQISPGLFKTLGASIPAAEVQTRFTAQVPVTPPPTQGWRIEASPGYSVGLAAGFLLADGPVAPDASTIGATYANPFTSQWHPTITYVANSQRAYNIGALTTAMTSSLRTIAEAGSSLTLDMPAGLPTMISINNQPLNNDGMTVSVDVKGPVFVDITSDRTANTLYEVTVVEIADAGTQITRTPVAVTTGTETRLPLPPNVLKVGHQYYLLVVCTSGGYTKAASGDLQTFALPVSHGSQEGAVFTVIAQ